MNPVLLIFAGIASLYWISKRGKKTRKQGGGIPLSSTYVLPESVECKIDPDLMQETVAPIYESIVAGAAEAGEPFPLDESDLIQSLVLESVDETCSASIRSRVVDDIAEKIVSIPSGAMHMGGSVNPFSVMGDVDVFIDNEFVASTPDGDVIVRERAGTVVLQLLRGGPVMGWGGASIDLVDEDGDVVETLISDFIPDPTREYETVDEARAAAEEEIVGMMESFPELEDLLDLSPPIAKDPPAGSPSEPLPIARDPSGHMIEDMEAYIRSQQSASRSAGEADRAVQQAATARAARAASEQDAARAAGEAARAVQQAAAARTARATSEQEAARAAGNAHRAAQEAARQREEEARRQAEEQRRIAEEEQRKIDEEEAKRKRKEKRKKKRKKKKEKKKEAATDLRQGVYYGKEKYPKDLRHAKYFGG